MVGDDKEIGFTPFSVEQGRSRDAASDRHRDERVLCTTCDSKTMHNMFLQLIYKSMFIQNYLNKVVCTESGAYGVKETKGLRQKWIQVNKKNINNIKQSQ